MGEDSSRVVVVVNRSVGRVKKAGKKRCCSNTNTTVRVSFDDSSSYALQLNRIGIGVEQVRGVKRNEKSNKKLMLCGLTNK